MTRNPLRLLLAALLASLLSGATGCSQDQPVAGGTGFTAEHRPDFTVADLEGQARSISEWDGKVVVVNFWATWCPPCRREIPTFVALQQEYGDDGLQFLGLSLDSAEQVRDFADTLDVNYPLLVGDRAVTRTAIAYGNTEGVLPYTAVIDRGGEVVFTLAGEFTREDAERVLLPLL